MIIDCAVRARGRRHGNAREMDLMNNDFNYTDNIAPAASAVIATFENRLKRTLNDIGE